MLAMSVDGEEIESYKILLNDGGRKVHAVAFLGSEFGLLFPVEIVPRSRVVSR